MGSSVRSALCAAVFLCALALVESVENARKPNVWVMLEVTSDGDATILDTHFTHHPPSRPVAAAPVDAVHVVFAEGTMASTAVAHTQGHVVSFHDDHDGTDPGKTSGGSYIEQRHTFTLVVPHGSRLAVAHSKSLHRVSAIGTPTVVRHFSALEDPTAPSPADSIVFREFQKGHATRHRTITFMSSGYNHEDESKFWGDVTRCIEVLQYGVPELDSDPWPRYFSLLNIFGIFQASEERGASMPTGGRIARNNLECSYGDPLVKRLGCNRAKVLSLASHAPQADLHVVLVNDNTYGGTGGGGIAAIYNGAELPFIFVHESNHAFALLGDEYSYGYAEPNPPTFANCAPTRSGVPWRHWITNGAVDATPSAGCTFTNLFRPTNENCLMRVIAPKMCAVCKDALIQKIYKADNVAARLDMASPRCPPEGLDVHVSNDTESTILSINHRFIALDNVNVTWELPGGSVIKRVPSITVLGKQLKLGNNIVRVNITDATDKTSLQAKFTTTTNFVLIVGKTGEPQCKEYSCMPTFGAALRYCGVCTRPEGCEQNFTAVPENVGLQDPRSLSQSGDLVLVAILVSVVVGAVTIAVCAAIYLIRKHRNPQEIFVVTGPRLWVHPTAVLLSFLLMVFACLVIIFAVVQYEKVSIFGRTLVIVFLAFACFMWVMSVIKGTSGMFRWVWPLAILNIFLLLFAIALFSVTVYTLHIVRNLDSQEITDDLAARWKSAAQSDPGAICTVQGVLQCSGFYSSCNPIISSYCPKDCEVHNMHTNSCLFAFRSLAKEALEPMCIVLIVACFFLVTSAIADFALVWVIQSVRSIQHAKRTYRLDPDAPVPAINEAEIVALEQEFRKADKDHNGSLEGKEVLSFLNTTMRTNLTGEDQKRIFHSIDANKDGRLTFAEIVHVFFPFFSGHKDPRKLTEEEASAARDMADLQRLQLNKLEEYVNAIGTLSPEALLDEHRKYVAATAGHKGERADETNASIMSIIPSMGSGPTFLDVVQSVAEDKRKNDPEAEQMCKGLGPFDLEGLRCQWSRLHPAIVGTLLDDEIALLYEWTHGEALVDHEHFLRWKDELDCRQTGVGWEEFCRIFAQRNLLRDAVRALQDYNKRCAMEHKPKKEYTPEKKSRAEVVREFGEDCLEEFLPYEEEIPVERVLVRSIRHATL